MVEHCDFDEQSTTTDGDRQDGCDPTSSCTCPAARSRGRLEGPTRRLPRRAARGRHRGGAAHTPRRSRPARPRAHPRSSARRRTGGSSPPRPSSSSCSYPTRRSCRSTGARRVADRARVRQQRHPRVADEPHRASPRRALRLAAGDDRGERPGSLRARPRALQAAGDDGRARREARRGLSTAP